jgi:hypothetical protein
MVLKNIEDAIKARWPEAVVQTFGSFPSNLSTFLSDVDITILGLAGHPAPEIKESPSMSFKRNLDDTSLLMNEFNKRQKTSGVDVEEDMELQIPESIIQEAPQAEQQAQEEEEVSWFIDRGEDVVILDPPNQPQAIIDLVTPPGSPAQDSDDSDTSPAPVFASEEEDDDLQEEKEEEDEDVEEKDLRDIDGDGFSSGSGGSLEGEDNEYSDFDTLSEDDDNDDSSDSEYSSLSEIDESEAKDLDIHIDGVSSSFASASASHRTHHSFPSPHQSHQTPPPSSANRQEENQILATLTQFLRSLDYTRALEFRSKARVPIINLIHKGDIECDISIGLSNQKTNNLIQLLSYQHHSSSEEPTQRPPEGRGRSSPASSSAPSSSTNFTKIFYEISCFLKVFFHQFYLDLPYTGGLGSYKIYGMLTFIINKIHEEQQSKGNSNSSSKGTERTGAASKTGDLTLDSGYILIYFFKYFGNKQNLNLKTVLRIQNQNSRSSSSSGKRGGKRQRQEEEESEEEEDEIIVEFSKTSQVTFCQQLCSRAYCVLYLIITKGIQHLSTIASSPSLTSSSSLRHHSTLSVLITRCDQFVQNRMLSSKLCRIECPLLLDCDKDNMAKIILKEMKEVLNSAIDQQVTPEDIQRYNPLLWERMRCYGRIPVLRGKLGGGSSGGSNGGGFFPRGGGGMDSGKGRASFPLTRKAQGYEANSKKKPNKPRHGGWQHEMNEALLAEELADQRERRAKKKKIKKKISEHQQGWKKFQQQAQESAAALGLTQKTKMKKKALTHLKKGKIRGNGSGGNGSGSGNKKKYDRRKTL